MNSRGFSSTHSQPAPNLSERRWAQASAGTTNCFMLCCHPVKSAGWPAKSLFAPCFTCLSTLCKPLRSFLPPALTHTHCHALNLSGNQWFSRWWDKTESGPHTTSWPHLVTRTEKEPEKLGFLALASAYCMVLSKWRWWHAARPPPWLPSQLNRVASFPTSWTCCRLIRQCWQSTLEM